MITRKELLQSKRGLTQLRGLLIDKRSSLKKEMNKMRGAARLQEAPPWVEDVKKEYVRASQSQAPMSHYLRVLNVLRKHKVL